VDDEDRATFEGTLREPVSAFWGPMTNATASASDTAVTVESIREAMDRLAAYAGPRRPGTATAQRAYARYHAAVDPAESGRDETAVQVRQLQVQMRGDEERYVRNLFLDTADDPEAVGRISRAAGRPVRAVASHYTEAANE